VENGSRLTKGVAGRGVNESGVLRDKVDRSDGNLDVNLAAR